jgi:lysozyme
MEPSTKAFDIIRLFEASNKCRLKAYLDTGGVPTIGWGTTAYPNGKKVQMGDICTEEEANVWLAHDVESSVQAIKRLVKVKISQSMFDALVSFVYNLGAGNFSKSTLLKLINMSNFNAAAEQFSRWRFDNGKEQPGLTKRRAAEEKLFRQGIRELPKS